MKCSILMVTYRRDLEFAEYSMRSAQKFAKGFHEMVCVVPTPDVEMFEQVAHPLGFHVASFDERPKKGFLHHEVIICEADKWCPDADAILHLDSDCLFLEPITPNDYIHEGRPVMCWQPYEEFKHFPNRYGWKKCVREAIGLDPENEFMCRHPSVYLLATYEKTRELILTTHPEMPWPEYILSCRNEYPQTFAEYPTLGHVAWTFFHNSYHWARFPKHNDGSIPALQREKLKAFWSVGGIEMINDRHPDETARQVMDRILAD